ncbi:hypothetical protein DPMN_186354 [Dreissena polymorpha]|uniref:Uncharacterized protein n=1 Tax=Dreissena polymorpha TaxID=45954 RepID=A0A9D4DM45_DREPO|nr:hypothetical protein DPMN_186354 [Dreissena polymorpha]
MSTHPTPTSKYGPVTYCSIVCKTQNKVCEPPRDSSTITATLTEKKRKRQRTYQDPSRTVNIGKFGCSKNNNIQLQPTTNRLLVLPVKVMRQ